MAAKATWARFYRIRTEASFNAASPEAGEEWNIGGNGGGANGWMDLPVSKDTDGLQPKSTIIFPTTQAGVRSMNTADPVAGAYPVELGTLPIYFYPELVDRILYATFGSVQRVAEAGTAAQASTSFASLATLTTQSDGTEVLKFTIADSDDADTAVISIIQGAVVQESITIGTSATTVDGVYYSKGAYKGTGTGGATISFTTSGTVTNGNVVVAGVDYITNTFTQGTTNPSLVIEQGGRQEAGSGNSEYLTGVIIPTLQITFDRSATDNLLMLEPTFQGLFGSSATAGAYANDATEYYRPLAGWTGAATIDAVANYEIVSANITIAPNTEVYQVASGSQNPYGKIEGEFEVFGTMTLIPAGETRWDDYRDSTPRTLVLTFTTPFYLVDTDAWTVTLTMTRVFLEDYTRNRQSMVQGAEIAFRGVYNSTDSGSAKLVTRCRMPV